MRTSLILGVVLLCCACNGTTPTSPIDNPLVGQSILENPNKDQISPIHSGNSWSYAKTTDPGAIVAASTLFEIDTCPKYQQFDYYETVSSTVFEKQGWSIFYQVGTRYYGATATGLVVGVKDPGIDGVLVQYQMPKTIAVGDSLLGEFLCVGIESVAIKDTTFRDCYHLVAIAGNGDRRDMWFHQSIGLIKSVGTDSQGRKDVIELQGFKIQ